MGEARRRGTFEERKAQAIAAGRVKDRTAEISFGGTEYGLLEVLSSIGSSVKRPKKTKNCLTGNF